jgi:hypothetical protein
LANEFLTELSNQIANDFACTRQANEMREIVSAACSVTSLPEPPVSINGATSAGSLSHSPNRSNERSLFPEGLSPPSASNELLPAFTERLSPSSASERMAYNERLNLLSSLTNSHLTFHDRCGSLIKLSNGARTAERKRPMEEFNNGVVMTSRPIKDDEMFEV